MKTYQEFLKMAKDPETNLEKLLDEVLVDCDTAEQILNRWNDFTEAVGGKRIFEWIEHNGKQVFWADTDKIGEDVFGRRQANLGVLLLIRYYNKLPKDKPFYAIFNMQKLGIDSELIINAKKILNVYNSFNECKVAYYGIPPVKKIILKVVTNKRISFAETKEEALEWVTN